MGRADTARERLRERILGRPCLIDCHAHIGVSYQSYLDYGYPYCMSFEDASIRMKVLGVDFSMLTPFGTSAYYRLWPGTPETVEPCEEFCRFPYEIENRSMLQEIYDVFPEYSESALPFLQFDPLRKAAEQAEHLEGLWAEYPVMGLKTVLTYIRSSATDLDGPGRPILDVAREHDLPIVFHCSWDREDPWANVSSILEVAERHPELRMMLAHSARFHRESLDRAASLENCFVDTSAFDIHCLLARMNHRAIPPQAQRLDAEYGDPPSVMRKLLTDYPDTIVWGSDTPGNYYIRKHRDAKGELVDCDLRSSFDAETKILRALTDAQVLRISYGNTVRFLFGPGAEKAADGKSLCGDKEEDGVEI